jgi:hypothetical protein
VVSAVAGSAQYTSVLVNQFPTQAFINRVAPHTAYVYVTSYTKNGTPGPLNGNIVFLVSGVDGSIAVLCSADDKVLKDTDWFKASRTAPPAWSGT